ncbi:septation protein SepH [Nonomuraea salmonea]|uniref:septation protein SepH n=1 Tax=Nonomuraea salmonea TaxID=46181 RepID=UPI002FE760AD
MLPSAATSPVSASTRSKWRVRCAPKEIQARIRAGETAEEIAATAGIPVERVRWFEGPVLQEREYVAQQAQRVAVRMPGESAPGPTLGDLVAERLTRRGVPTDEIDWDSAKRDDGLWRVKLGYVWNGHTRHAEWLFDPRKRHVTPHDDEALRLSAADFDPEPPVVEDTTVTPFAPRVAKLQPVPPLSSETLPFPSVVRREPEEPAVGYEPAGRSGDGAYPSSRGTRDSSHDDDFFDPPAPAGPPAASDTSTRDERRPAPFDPLTRDPARQEPAAREPFHPPTHEQPRPEPGRETGYTRPGDPTRRGGSSPWLPDFSSGRDPESAIYAPADRTPVTAEPTRPADHTSGATQLIRPADHAPVTEPTGPGGP